MIALGWDGGQHGRQEFFELHVHMTKPAVKFYCNKREHSKLTIAEKVTGIVNNNT